METIPVLDFDQSYFIPEFFRVKNVRLMGGSAVPVDSSGTDLRKLSVQHSWDYLKGPFDPASEAIKLKGSWLLLYGNLDEYFYHWSSEFLPSLLLAQHIDLDVNYLIPSSKRSPYARAYLEILGVAPEKILEYEGMDFIVEDLYFLRRRHGTGYAKHWQIVDLVRKSLLEKVSEIAPHFPERVYMSRGMAASRRVTNEKEVIRLLSDFGFKTYKMETMDLKSQIALASTATAMVFPHGSGLFHTTFMPPGSLIVEMFPEIYVTTHTMQIARPLGHRYYQCIKKATPLVVNIDKVTSNLVDLEANLIFLEIILERELSVATAIPPIVSIKTERRILLIGTARKEACERAARAILKEFPDASLDLLCRDVYSEALGDIAGFNAVNTYSGEFLKVEKEVGGLIDELALQKYDVVVIAFSDLIGEGYENVKEFAGQLDSQLVLGINRNGKSAYSAISENAQLKRP